MVKTIFMLFFIAGVVMVTGAVIVAKRDNNPIPPVVINNQDISEDNKPDVGPDQTDVQTKKPTPNITKKPFAPETDSYPATPQNTPVDPVPAAPAISATSVCNTALINSDGFDSMRVISKEACDLVNNLYVEGKAAGNFDDTYENRDGLHVNFCDGWSPNPECPMAYRLFPQHKWFFSGGAGRATGVRPGITVGQASYSGVTEGGVKHGIAYAFYKTESDVNILYNQYIHNNLYIYPSVEESKKDNIANTPYLISSEYFRQDSGNYYANAASGSDLPFVKIAMLGLASFKPEVKSTLKNSSLLMPTLQMLIRHAHRSVGNEGDYLVSVAHDSISRAHYFSGGLPQPNYSSAKLVRIVNELALSDVPPLVRIEVVSENFTDSEKLFNTPGAIARSVAAGTSRNITVGAGDSIDLNGSKSGHIYEWRILKGGSKVKITENANTPSTAVIEFTPGSAGERLEVGVFVKKANGKYYSVPGIISVYVHE